MTPSHPHPPLSPVEKLEDDASLAGIAAADALGAIDVAAVVLLGLLVVPPLAILAVVVVVPILAVALVLGVLAAVVTAPYLLVHHFRDRDGGHVTLLGQRLRRAARAVVDLAPHRIVADARKVGRGRDALHTA